MTAANSGASTGTRYSSARPRLGAMTPALA
jgi:hypothetical protein